VFNCEEVRFGVGRLGLSDADWGVTGKSDDGRMRSLFVADVFEGARVIQLSLQRRFS
jgi:hypothetical protein